jgi:hypothetical protein
MIQAGQAAVRESDSLTRALARTTPEGVPPTRYIVGRWWNFIKGGLDREDGDVENEYIQKLCNERHERINERLHDREEEDGKLHERVDNVITAVNGKFTKLLYTLLGMAALGALNLLLLVFSLLKQVPK